MEKQTKPKPKTLSEVMGLPKGSFAKHLKSTKAKEAREEKADAKRIRKARAKSPPEILNDIHERNPVTLADALACIEWLELRLEASVESMSTIRSSVFSISVGQSLIDAAIPEIRDWLANTTH